jgi:hypothetical protein
VVVLRGVRREGADMGDGVGRCWENRRVITGSVWIAPENTEQCIQVVGFGRNN